LDPDDTETPRWMAQALASGRPIPAFDGVRRHRDGHLIDVHLTVGLIRDQAGELTSIAVAARDLSERVRMERALAESERRYRQMFEHNPHPTWVFDSGSLRFLAVNRRAVEVYGYSEAEFLAMTIEDICPEEDIEALRADLAGGAQQPDHWRHRKRSGEVIDVEVLASDFELGGHRGRLVVATDITARLGAERRLQRMVDHDSLTGTFSRDRLHREIEALLEGADRARGCAVIVIDLDHFKFVNDSFGHSRGDQLISRVATALTSQLCPGQSLGRLGGDAFGVALPDTGEAAAYEIASRLLGHIRETVTEGLRTITASAGVAASPADAGGDGRGPAGRRRHRAVRGQGHRPGPRGRGRHSEARPYLDR